MFLPFHHKVGIIFGELLPKRNTNECFLRLFNRIREGQLKGSDLRSCFRADEIFWVGDSDSVNGIIVSVYGIFFHSHVYVINLGIGIRSDEEGVRGCG